MRSIQYPLCTCLYKLVRKSASVCLCVSEIGGCTCGFCALKAFHLSRVQTPWDINLLSFSLSTQNYPRVFQAHVSFIKKKKTCKKKLTATRLTGVFSACYWEGGGENWFTIVSHANRSPPWAVFSLATDLLFNKCFMETSADQRQRPPHSPPDTKEALNAIWRWLMYIILILPAACCLRGRRAGTC